MNNTIIGAGIACIAAAIVGGGLKMFGIEVPVLSSIRRQLLLAAFGALLVFSPLLKSLLLTRPKAPVLTTLERQAAIQELASTRDAKAFAQLFNSTFVPVNWSNLDAVLELDRELGPILGDLYGKCYIKETKENNWDLLTEAERKELSYTRDAIKYISVAVGSLLKAPRPGGQEVNLSSGWFCDCDWRGVNLDGANLDNIDMRSCNLKGADLGEVTSFQGMYMWRTSWWEAKRISPELLQYLLDNSHYEPAYTYGPQEAHVSARDYEASIARLRAGK